MNIYKRIKKNYNRYKFFHSNQVYNTEEAVLISRLNRFTIYKKLIEITPHIRDIINKFIWHSDWCEYEENPFDIFKVIERYLDTGTIIGTLNVLEIISRCRYNDSLRENLSQLISREFVNKGYNVKRYNFDKNVLFIGISIDKNKKA